MTQRMVWMAVALVLIAGAWTLHGSSPDETRQGEARPAMREAPAIRSVTLDARRAPGVATLDSIAALGTTHVTVIPFAFQETLHTPALRMNTDARWYSESDQGIRTLAAEARERGMGFILKPHIWVGSYDVAGQTRANISFETEAAWQAWEAQYRAFLFHYADLAEQVQADVLVIGTELATPARLRPAFWHNLIGAVRARYQGQLTYAANWYEEYEHVTFWDQLDFIGVQAYFPISDASEPAVSTLADGWTRHLAAVELLAERSQRQVLFTELGYRSISYAAAEPWRWPRRDEEHALDLDLQARLYQAFFDVWWHRPSLAGAILWKWHPTAEATRPRRRVGFTPQNKPAEHVIREAFQR